MGQATPENTERNLKVYKDYKSGKFSMIDLVVRYRISSTRIKQIVDREEKRKAV